MQYTCVFKVAESGYERAKDEIMYYISSNGTVQKWTNAEWVSHNLLFNKIILL